MRFQRAAGLTIRRRVFECDLHAFVEQNSTMGIYAPRHHIVLTRAPKDTSCPCFCQLASLYSCGILKARTHDTLILNGPRLILLLSTCLTRSKLPAPTNNCSYILLATDDKDSDSSEYSLYRYTTLNMKRVHVQAARLASARGDYYTAQRYIALR